MFHLDPHPRLVFQHLLNTHYQVTLKHGPCIIDDIFFQRVLCTFPKARQKFVLNVLFSTGDFSYRYST